MQRVLQIMALCLSVGLLAFLACRAQRGQPAATGNAAGTGATVPDDAAAPPIDAAAPPAVYFPASKSGGMFLEHQQAPR